MIPCKGRHAFLQMTALVSCLKSQKKQSRCRKLADWIEVDISKPSISGCKLLHGANEPAKDSVQCLFRSSGWHMALQLPPSAESSTMWKNSFMLSCFEAAHPATVMCKHFYSLSRTGHLAPSHRLPGCSSKWRQLSWVQDCTKLH